MRVSRNPWWYWFGDHAGLLFWFLMGVAIGATLAVHFGAVVKISGEVAGLLGGILGAGLGAAGGVLGGLVVYQKQRRDALMPTAISVLSELQPLMLILEALERVPMDQGLLHIFEQMTAGWLRSVGNMELTVFGSEISALFNGFRSIMRVTHVHMETPAFKATRTAATPNMKNQLHVARVTLVELVVRLQAIVGEE